MNLHGIVRGAITSVNPDVWATIRVSTGYTTLPSGRQQPQYENVDVKIQVQALTYTDLMKLDGLNIQGVRRAIYAYGFYAGVIRDRARGGDLVTFADGVVPEGQVWLIAQELEVWPDWVKFVITLQNGE